MKKLMIIVDKISGLAGWLSGLMVCVGLGLVLSEIVVRTFFDSTIYVAEEYAGYLMCALTFCALSYTLKEKGHIRMTFLQKMITGTSRIRLDLVCSVLGFLFCVALTLFTWLFFCDSVVNQSQSMQISETYLAIPQFFMPLGAFMLTMQFLSELIKCLLQIKGDTEGISFAQESEDLGR